MLLLVFLLFMLVAAVFAYGNRDLISIDLGFARVDNVSMTLAFAVAFAAGGAFGVCCVGLGYLKLIAKMRLVRRQFNAAESELSRLRSAPLHDAD
jgi:uncharacterized membrane protein YciS (DUF1049 family)